MGSGIPRIYGRTNFVTFLVNKHRRIVATDAVATECYSSTTTHHCTNCTPLMLRYGVSEHLYHGVIPCSWIISDQIGMKFMHLFRLNYNWFVGGIIRLFTCFLSWLSYHASRSIQTWTWTTAVSEAIYSYVSWFDRNKAIEKCVILITWAASIQFFVWIYKFSI